MTNKYKNIFANVIALAILLAALSYAYLNFAFWRIATSGGDMECAENLFAIYKLAESYKEKNGIWPSAISQIGAPETISHCPRDPQKEEYAIKYDSTDGSLIKCPFHLQSRRKWNLKFDKTFNVLYANGFVTRLDGKY